jgi:hypothetical protein
MSNLKYFVLAIVVMAMAACSPAQFPKKVSYTNHDKDPNITRSEVTPIYIDKDFGDQNRADIIMSVRQLNVVFNGYKRVDVVNDHLDIGDKTLVQSILESRDAIIIVDIGDLDSTQAVEPGVLAFTDPETGVIFMLPLRVGSRDMVAILLHEEVHAFGGTPHINTFGSLLFPVYGQVGCVDELTVRDLATTLSLTNGVFLDYRHFNWCE